MSCTIITVGSWFVSMLTDSIQHGNNPRVGHFIPPSSVGSIGGGKLVIMVYSDCLNRL